MAANATVGTTPAILAPYLAAEPPIKVQVSHTVANEVEEAELIGLAASARIRFADGFTQWADVWRIKPILRPFSALCEPLEDGTVPARRIAEIVLAVPDCFDQADWDWAELKAEVDDDDQGVGHLSIRVWDKQVGADCFVYLWPDGTLQVHGGPHSNQLEVFDYLRSQHFALPVNGRPLLEGVDYIPKTSAAAPIDKNTAL